ncbi:helix-turn-helix domain-containing protein [Gordonia malaquae]|uniref:helix-turn-helix transcriptional regulator n=1 Tax=Gordonia malaquae TaxID=410332 RepID=UPI003019F004
MTGRKRTPNRPTVYLSAGQAAERLGCPLNTVTSYIRRNQFPPHDAIIGRNRGWLPATIDQWNPPRTSQGQPEETDDQ